ncbi:general transcription factor II-I repeat domain-containing protein 2B-like [Lepeophtheirus salmonis]|uniref:general transcription factor II-I repeat domain-containing protein 2B-like n=1 Tax=Lepeophtheirus salmonis TaxID=72036 RepID=UPI001AE364BF|nr:general transcription factor II-I repeat domain-containing protein 2B-like [Lepeophtheirus salmonis]
MHGTITGKYIFMGVQKTLQDYSLQLNQVRGVTVDREKHMAGVRKRVLKRFLDLDRIWRDILLFQNPFDYNLYDVPVELKLEVIDLQANCLLKEKHREGKKLVAFYSSLPDGEFSKLKNFAVAMASLFGTTYVCGQTFSKMNYVKSAHRTQLTD